MRKVKGPASCSGPSMTAIFAPGGNAGTSVHLKSEGVTNACPSAAYAGGIRKTQSPPKRAAVTATGFIASSLVLLCHKLRCLLRAAQHGQRESVVARAATNLRRIVAIEFGTWRSGRNGGSSGLVTFA